jgi:hypothetical protein
VVFGEFKTTWRLGSLAYQAGRSVVLTGQGKKSVNPSRRNVTLVAGAMAIIILFVLLYFYFYFASLFFQFFSSFCLLNISSALGDNIP